MKITKDFIFTNRTSKGGWTAAQFKAIGVDWPPMKGWIDRVIGHEISDENAEIFIANGRRRQKQFSGKEEIESNQLSFLKSIIDQDQK